MAITEEEIGQAVSRELDRAITWKDGELTTQQADNLKYYYREPFGNEKKDRSQIVTADVMETVEGIMPDLMKIFTSDDNAVAFEPVGPEDVEASEQATDYLNHIFMRRMDGFKLLYDWFKDGLLMKNGIIRVGWEEEDVVEFHNFKGLTEDELDELEAEEEVAEIEEEKQEDGTYNVRVKRVIKGGKPFAETIPSEDFYIRERSKSIEESEFHAYVSEKTVGELIQQGFKEDDITEDSGSEMVTTTGPGKNRVEDARFSDPREGTHLLSAVSPQDEDKLIKVTEAFIRLYDEDDEVVKLYHVIMTGSNNVLSMEEVNCSDFISIAPIMMPHKFTGVAVADLVRDIQEINSSLWRQMLDNLALQNSGRYAAVEGQANLQDLLDNKIGGVVRMKAQGAVQQLDTPNLSPFTVEALDRLQEKKETRVGVSRMTAGLDVNALNSHTTATGVNQVMTAAQQKILLIARIYAETGVKNLFRKLYEEVRTHSTKEDVVRLRGQFVAVRPFDWIDRKDMQVTVGIGNGNKDQQAYHLQQIGTMLQQIGGTEYGYLISPQNVYGYATEMIKNSGYKNPELFISDPRNTPPPPPQPNPDLIEAQAEAAKDMSQAKKNEAEAEAKLIEARNKTLELELEREKFEWQKKVDAAELSVEASQERPVGIGTGR